MRLPASDRFLIGIVVGSVLLISIAVVIVLNRATPAYRTGNEPADVVYCLVAIPPRLYLPLDFSDVMASGSW